MKWVVLSGAPVYYRDGHKTVDAVCLMVPDEFEALRAKIVRDWDADLRAGKITINDFRRSLGMTPFDLIDPTTVRIQVPKLDGKA